MGDTDTAWQQFCDDEFEEQHHFSTNTNTKGKAMVAPLNVGAETIPKSNSLYISTQTIISYLDTDVNLNEVFWKLPLIPYYLPQEGVVKKQIKFNSHSVEELQYILGQKTQYPYVDEYIITHIDNPSGRIKFKDVRKLSIGISKKDITSYRCKRKSAFYNCVVIILRLLDNDIFKEIHVKIFNTGKIEIPGIQNSAILHKVYTLLVETIKPFITNPVKIAFIHAKTETVLINSNFNCGYYLKRDVLNDLFKKKYNDKIRSSYDPCTYPGIQCEIYYNQDLVDKDVLEALTIVDMKTTANITKVSFMVFRTGSVLIVGKCSEAILHNIYELLCSIFVSEYDRIHENNVTKLLNKGIKQTRNSRMKSITVNII
jgi:TATA-box binding protein (TBP) (component of TFIID and TFIIIB)